MKTAEILRKTALALPDTEEGVACKGTSLESRTFVAKKKAFLFVRAKGDTIEARLKLRDSIGAAEKAAAKEPEKYDVGSLGWVLVRLPSDEAPPKALMERWIAESYCVVVGEPNAKAKAKAAKRGGPSQKRAAPARRKGA